MDYGAVLMDTEIIEKIKFVLKDKVAPSVAAHGGKIEFKSFEDGKLKLMMAGYTKQHMVTILDYSMAR